MNTPAVSTLCSCRSRQSRRFRWQLFRLSFGEPLKMFEQLGGFNSEGRGEVLGRVELVPVAFSGEGAGLLAEGFEVRHRVTGMGRVQQ